MNLTFYVDEFGRNAERIRMLVAGTPAEEARWKPSENAWSLLEVVNHLHDEETEDFRLRIRYLFDRPGDPWPPIDPEGWVVERAYNTRELGTSLDAFLEERRRSLEWLAALPDDLDWNRVYNGPKLQGLRAGDLLVSWMAHDYLHMRQILRLKFLRAEAAAPSYATSYAGRW